MGIYKQLIQLFGLMIIGFIGYKTKILDDTANKKISRFIVNIALPATIINSAIGKELADPTAYLSVSIAWILIYTAGPLLAFLICKLLKYSKTMELMMAYANIGFMGLPLVSAIWGDDYLIYVVIGMMCFNLSLFSYGVYALKKQKAKDAKPDLKKTLLSCLNPGTLCAVIAVCILIFRIPVPDVVSGIFSSVGSVTVPLAMIVIGSTLGNLKFKEVFGDPRIYVFTAVKVLVFPAVTFLLARIFIHDTAIVGILTLLSSTPTAGNVSMICSEYDGDLPLVSKGTCISTLFSALTIPLWIFIVQKFAG